MFVYNVIVLVNIIIPIIFIKGGQINEGWICFFLYRVVLGGGQWKAKTVATAVIEPDIIHTY